MASSVPDRRVCEICKREIPAEEYVIAYYYSPESTKRFCLACAAPVVDFLKKNGLVARPG